MSLARELLASEDRRPGRDVVAIADFQRAGRGRFSRRWEAAPGSALLATVGLADPRQTDPALADRYALITAALGLAALDAIDQVGGLGTARLKWPNDIVVAADNAEGYRKLGGILAEADWRDGERGPVLLCGIGLNLAVGAVPADVNAQASSVAQETGGGWSADQTVALVAEMLQGFDGRLAAIETVGIEPLVHDWQARCLTIGTSVRVDASIEGQASADDAVEGVAECLRSDGALGVRGDDGVMRWVTFGEVFRLRTVTPDGDATPSQ